MLFLIAACFVSGLVVSAIATALMRRIAPRIGFVDRPNARKVHATPIALGGGVAIWLGIVLPLAAAQGMVYLLQHFTPLSTWIPPQIQLNSQGVSSLQQAPYQPPTWIPADILQHVGGVSYRATQLWAILAGGTVISALGLIDDLRNLSWQPKLLVQFAVAIALVSGGVSATVFVSAPWFGWGLTVLWIVVLTNAFNFLDNMDGLSSGISLIAAVIFATIMLTSTATPHWFVAGFLLVIAGSTAGFLLHNWPPAKIFMGDTGSCLLGMLLASATVTGTFYDYETSSKHVLLAPLCVLAVPLYDFCSVVLIRLSQGRSPFHADKCHFSHRLVELGLSKRSAVLTIYLVTLTTGLGGLLLYQVKDWTGAALVMASEGCLLAIVAILETVGRRNDKT